MHCPSLHRDPSRGFTLIEVMITVAIVAILTMIAYPSYSDYVVRGNVPEATTRLSTKAVQMEQFFQDNRTYVGGPGCANDTTSSKYFDFGCAGAGAATATAYTITATGKGSMTGIGYTINQAGAKTTSITSGAPSGWAAPSTNNCWATRKGGQC